jgi:hypothetical protein
VSPRDELAETIARLDEAQLDALGRFVASLGPGESQRSQLLGVVASLDDEGVARVLDIARAMDRPVEAVVNSASKVVTPEFEAEFRSRLLAHHATHTTKLDRLGFENAFLAASRAATRQTAEAPSATTRFWDARVDGEQTALKSEGAKSMKPDFLHISKLSEAAWIQDVRSAKTRHEHMIALTREFIAAVNRMFVLRITESDTTAMYELVEIPVEYFKLILALPVSAFASDAPKIPIEDERGSIMELRLDRSDAKITIAKIRKDRCIVHATWTLTLASSA